MPRIDTRFQHVRARRERATRDALSDLFDRQLDDVTARRESGSRTLLPKRWDGRLADVIYEQNRLTAREIASRVAKGLGSEARAVWDLDVMDGWLQAVAASSAELINQATRDKLDESEAAEDVDDPIAHVFGILLTSSVAMYARSMVTSTSGFASHEAGRRSDARVKIWRVNSTNPRSSHKRLNGESVPLDAKFSNGLEWPGDFEGGADEVANCKCSMTMLA